MSRIGSIRLSLLSVYICRRRLTIILTLASILVANSLPYAYSDEKYGRLKVVTDPPGADVVIAAELGKTPLSNDFLNLGLYRIEISHPNGKYLPISKEISLVDGHEPIIISQTLTKPPILTKKRGIQLLLGAGAITGFVYAIFEQDRASKYRERAKTVNLQDAEEYSKTSKEAATRRTVAAVSAGLLTATLEVTVFIW